LKSWNSSSPAERGQQGREGAFLLRSALLSFRSQPLSGGSSWSVDLIHGIQHVTQDLCYVKGTVILCFKVPVKKGFMKVGHSLALVNVYCYSDRVLSGVITCVRPELRVGRHKHPGEGCSRRTWISSTCSLQWGLAARKHSSCEHPPCWDFWGDVRMRRDLPTQVLSSAQDSEGCRKEKEKNGEDLAGCRGSFRMTEMLI